MDRIAAIIIATERRKQQLTRVIDSTCAHNFNDIVVVGDWEYNDEWSNFLNVAPLTRTTVDALVKRDIGTLSVPEASVLVYLCDDHILAPGFGAALRAVLDEPWDVIVPNRYTKRIVCGCGHGCTAECEGCEVEETLPLNNGERDDYCGGHGGIFRRHVITAKPWSAHAHHRNWDAQISAEQIARGARFVWSPRAELSIIDIEPQMEPWK